jgi:TIR domain
VFMDVNAIQPGRDFRKAIDESIHKCSVLLAVLGRDWLELKDASGQRRLDDETDFVRLEIASALQRDIPVVPVLVRGARMPRAEQLPADLRELAYRNAVELTHARWKSDVRVLIQALRPYLEASREEVSPQVVSSGETPVASGLMQQPVMEAKPPAAAIGIESAILERVGRELAGYIGPIAELVVKRAAKRCASLSDLCAMVAQEIESGADRAKFLAACRR